jgi:hypothetical protein
MKMAKKNLDVRGSKNQLKSFKDTIILESFEH